MDQNNDADRCNVLSDDEERTLFVLRQIIANKRAEDAAADIEAVVRTMIDSGASKIVDSQGREFWTLRLCRAHFSLEVHPFPNAGVEINFDRG